MTLYLDTDTTEPKSPISATPGMGFNGKPVPRIYDFLYAVETTQPRYPFQFTGPSYSGEVHFPAELSNPQIPSWMSPDYPFVAPTEDIQGLVVDTLLSFDDPLDNIEVPIKLSRITKHSDGLYSVRFTDINDNAVFDSSCFNYTLDSIEVSGKTYTKKAINQTGNCKYKRSEWGTYYELLYWETELITCRMIIRKNSLRQFALYPNSAELDARALYQYPKRVRSITIQSDNDWKSEWDLLPPYNIPKYSSEEQITGGSVELWEGYNMQFSWADNSALRTSHIITLSAVKGAGSGAAELDCPKDEPSILVTSINGVKATDDGAIFIQTDACHTIKGEDKIVIGNDCKPCCECQDMSNLGKLINQVEDEYYCIGGKYQVAAEKVIEEIENLEARIEEEDSRAPEVEYDVVEGNRMFLRFRFIFRNRRNACISNLSITFTTSKNMSVYKGITSAVLEKGYSECTEIDEQANFAYVSKILSTDKANWEHTVTWNGKLAPGQQVYLKGLWKLDTASTVYSNQLTSVQYYDIKTNTTRMVTLGLAGQLHQYSYTGQKITDVFDDYTSSKYISSKDVDDLEDEVRDLCRDPNLDHNEEDALDKWAQKDSFKDSTTGELRSDLTEEELEIIRNHKHDDNVEDK